MVGYIFGGKDMPKSAQELKRLRATAAALAPSRTPQNVGEGLNAIGQALAYRMMLSKADQGEAAGTNAANNAFTALMRGGMGGAAPSMDAAPSAAPVAAPPGTMVPNQPPVPGLNRAPSPANPDESYIRSGLVQRGLPEHVADAFVANFKDESGLNPGINEANPVVPGSRGGFGLYQLTGPRRKAYEAYAAEKGVDPANTDAQLDFLITELQGPEKAAAQKILSAPDTGTAAQAIVSNFLRPAPEHRERRSAAYAALSGGPVEVAQAAPQRQGIMSALMGGPQPTASDMPADYFPPAPSQGGGIDMMQAQELLGNEFLPQGRRAALEALVASEQQRQQMAQEQQMKQSDPAYQLGLQKTQLELQQMQQPKPGFKTLTDDEEKTMGLDPAGIYQQGPDNKLVVVREPPKAPEQPTNIREYEYAVKQARDAGVPADQIPSYDAWSVSQKKAGAQNINVGGGENKQVFDAVAASADTARSTVAGLNSLREAKKAVEGGIISGAGADTMLGLQKIGAALGVADPNVIVNTETFRSAIAPQVAAVMKATVGSANISNTDREFAEKAAGGNINLDEGTIRRLLDIMERASTASVNAHIDRLNRVYPDGKGFDRERALFGVDLPQPEPAAQPAPAAPQAAPAGEPSIDDLLKMYGK